jgi:molybdopterin-guanine dinucleotide biosynthesis adapter protein
VRIAAFVGPSGSGKTTLICELIRHFAAAGERVAAIKHTHHSINQESRGDTAAFEAAGAEPVIFASDDEAIVFTRGDPRRIKFRSPQELLDRAGSDIVFVEGFKAFHDWPQVELNRRISPAEALVILDKMWFQRS